MTLQDLRRHAVRNRCRIRFQVETAGECLIDEHGLLRVPALRTATTLNIVEALGTVAEFILEPASENPRRQVLSPAELQERLGGASSAVRPTEE